MSLSHTRPGFMPNEAIKMLLVRSLLCGSLAAAGGLPAAAQDSSTTVAGFLCEIDLAGNNLGVGSIYTFDSTKHCINSQTSENVKIDCRAKIANWTRGNVVLQNVACTVSGASCGIGGPSLNAINNRLTVDAAGNALLTCQVK
jgi:hypothetical protein